MAHAFQAITTKYLGPTNHRGSRVKATCDAGSLTVSWDYALNVESNHAAAVIALAKELGWSGPWHLGGTKTGYVGVQITEHTQIKSNTL